MKDYSGKFGLAAYCNIYVFLRAIYNHDQRRRTINFCSIYTYYLWLQYNGAATIAGENECVKQ